MTKHSPGPWTFEEEDFMVYSANDDAIAAIHEDFDEENTADECIANARLIAAAPELLEAAKVTRSFIRELETKHDDFSAPLLALDAAITKAEGK